MPPGYWNAEGGNIQSIVRFSWHIKLDNDNNIKEQEMFTYFDTTTCRTYKLQGFVAVTNKVEGNKHWYTASYPALNIGGSGANLELALNELMEALYIRMTEHGHRSDKLGALIRANVTIVQHSTQPAQSRK